MITTLNIYGVIFISKNTDNLSLSNSDLLKYALENGIIDVDTIQNKIEMNERKKYLKSHNFQIWQGKDLKWYTYLPDEVKGRVLKKRTTKKALEDLIVSFYKEQAEDPTVESVFEDWLEFKSKQVSKATIDRYKRQFIQCCEVFGKRKIRYITESDIEDFITDAIIDYKLTAKGYANLRTLLYGIFKRAKKLGLIKFSITTTVKDIDLSRNIFRRVYHEDDELVFMEDELPKVYEVLENSPDLINLGILLMFKSGMRIGELVALRKEDIQDNCIYVRKTETRYTENGFTYYEVKDAPKSFAGIRRVIIRDSDKWILQRIRSINPFGEYLFEINGERMHTPQFRTRMQTICKHAKVVRKSPNKIRKTYASIMIDSGVNESLLIGQIGHTDISTTKNHYYKNRKNLEEKAKIINAVQGL